MTGTDILHWALNALGVPAIGILWTMQSRLVRLETQIELLLKKAGVQK